jgi:SAM-dependent methyltransferase
MTNRWMTIRESCPGCGSTGTRTLYRCPFDRDPIREYLDRFYAPQGGVEPHYLIGAEYHLLECSTCELVFQREVGGDELMLRLYECWIDPELAFRRHLDQINLATYSRYAQEVTQIVTWLDATPSRVDVLDFGMGWGRWARMAQAFGCNARGAELSPRRIEYAARHGVRALSWDEIPQHRFDLINTDQVFEHIADPLATLKHLVLALKPGGIVKLNVPDGTDIRKRLEQMDWTAPIGSPRSLHAVAPLEHINCFSRKALLRMGARVGLEAVKMPLSVQYRCTAAWLGRNRVVKNLLLPIYHNVLQRGTYLFFRRPEAAS